MDNRVYARLFCSFFSSETHTSRLISKTSARNRGYSLPSRSDASAEMRSKNWWKILKPAGMRCLRALRLTVWVGVGTSSRCHRSTVLDFCRAASKRSRDQRISVPIYYISRTSRPMASTSTVVNTAREREFLPQKHVRQQQQWAQTCEILSQNETNVERAARACSSCMRANGCTDRR